MSAALEIAAAGRQLAGVFVWSLGGLGVAAMISLLLALLAMRSR